MNSRGKYDDEIEAERVSQEKIRHGMAVREDERTFGVAARALRALVASMRLDEMNGLYWWDERSILGMDQAEASEIMKAIRGRPKAKAARGEP